MKLVVAILVFSVLGTSCRNGMVNQQHLNPLAEETFFKDGSGARPIPPHTVARGQLNEDQQFFEGKSGGQLVTTFPAPVTRQMIEHGRESFDVYCAVCHGRTGEGNGMIVQRGFPAPIGCPGHCHDANSDRRSMGLGNSSLVRGCFHGSPGRCLALCPDPRWDARFVPMVATGCDSDARLGAQTCLSQHPVFHGENRVLLRGSDHHGAIAATLVDPTGGGRPNGCAAPASVERRRLSSLRALHEFCLHRLGDVA
jgi:hypothetical protein